VRIAFEQVTHTYVAPSFTEVALKDLTFAVEQGEFFSIIGHTGSGKSTLIQHINGLLTPTSGRVLVDGEDITDKRVRARTRRRVGMVFQYPEKQLFAKTVAEDVAFAPRNAGLTGPELDAAVRLALIQVDLDYDEFADASPFELSGGQQRRVALAGVIASAPELLVLDEPTAGLDPISRDEVMDIVVRLHDEGKTIVMVSHSMDDVARFSDRVLALNAGEMLFLGTPGEVFSHATELRVVNLGVPHVTQLVNELNAHGFALPATLYDVEAFADAVADELERLGVPRRDTQAGA